MSAEILDEIRSVLLRRKIQQKFPLLSETRVEAFVQRIQALAVSLAIVPPVFRLVRDPGDDPYINLAVAGEADFLVTRDRDLLQLAVENDAQGQELRRLRPQLSIVNPVALLSEIATAETGQ